MSGALKITPGVDGRVTVTVTEQSGPALSISVKTVVDWRDFCRQAWPIVQSYTPGHRDGIADVLPPAGRSDLGGGFVLVPVEEE